MHYFLVFSLLTGLLYSILKLFHNKISKFKSSISVDAIILFILLKTITALCLFIFINGSIKDSISGNEQIDQHKYMLSLQLLSYTIGDICILGNELMAMIFFGLGHVCFLNIFMPHQFIEAITHPFLTIGLVGIPSAVFYFLPSKVTNHGNVVQMFHTLILIIYMILLYMVWIMPIFHWYFPGMMLFVISDLFIVFQWPGAWFAEYMLYIGSLVSLYVWYTF